MSNLFSSFDPSIGIFSLSMNWASMASLIFIPSAFWLVSSKPLTLLKNFKLILSNEIKLVNQKTSANSIPLAMVSIFSLLIMNNFLGLLPYVFTASSHLAFTLPLSVSLWTGYILYSTLFNLSSFLAHLVPSGTPLILVPFMVVIEIISALMRPFTLGIRLAANMIAGHLLLILTSSAMPSMAPHIFMLAFLGLLALMTLEVGVSFIQGYVFTSLKSMYISEINHPNL